MNQGLTSSCPTQSLGVRPHGREFDHVHVESYSSLSPPSSVGVRGRKGRVLIYILTQRHQKDVTQINLHRRSPLQSWIRGCVHCELRWRCEWNRYLSRSLSSAVSVGRSLPLTSSPCDPIHKGCLASDGFLCSPNRSCECLRFFQQYTCRMSASVKKKERKK